MQHTSPFVMIECRFWYQQAQGHKHNFFNKNRIFFESVLGASNFANELSNSSLLINFDSLVDPTSRIRSMAAIGDKIAL